MTHSESVGALAAALAKAQGAIAGATKDSTNPHFNSKYADLASIVEACRAPLAAQGIAYLQSSSADANIVKMTTMLIHASGEWIESDPLQVQARDAAPQAIGSCLTYLRRYQLAAMVGIAPEDDDAEAAEGRAVPASTPAATTAPRPAPRAPQAAHVKAPRPLAVPPMHAPGAPEPPPLTDKDIPFMWLAPLLLAIEGAL